MRKYKNIKVIGSNALGRRVRVTPGDANPPGFISDCDWVDEGVAKEMCGEDNYDHGRITLWLENLDISGFSTIRLRDDGTTDEPAPYAIRIGKESSLTLEKCKLSDNFGFALYVAGPDAFVIVRGSEFVDNRASSHGAGIQVGWMIQSYGHYGSSVVEVADSIFARNMAPQWGAAISAIADSTLTIRNCSMSQNRAGSYGGAVVLDGDLVVTKKLAIQDSLFRNNTAGNQAGAMYTGTNIILEIANTVFADNAAYGTGGGAMWTSADSRAVITASNFDRNMALAGAGGALLTSATELSLVDVNFTENFAATDGGAVKSNTQTIVYPRGATRFVRNVAHENGGAVALDASSLKTNEASLVFSANEARLGGALSVVNEASAFLSAGCRTVTFEMQFAQSATLEYAENSHSVLLRRIAQGEHDGSKCADDNEDCCASEMWNEARSCSGGFVAFQTSAEDCPSTWDGCGTYANGIGCYGCYPPVPPISSGEVTDDRGEMTILFPSGAEDTSHNFCLSPGEYELIGSEGAFCFEGWGGGYLRIVDITGTELLSYFTLPADAGCAVRTKLAVPEDDTLTKYQGSVLFEDNHAAGAIPGFCGAGCGGALYVGEYCTAELDRIDFARNSAADGGALFVDLLGDLSLSRVIMRSNRASGDGGAIGVGAIAAVSVRESIARYNVAGGSGGMLHLSNAMSAKLQGIDATGNKAGASGGAVAAFDATRTLVTLTNSTIRGHTASDSGGGLFLKDSVMGLVGVEMSENSAEHGDGGALATSGINTFLEISDAECVRVDVLLDWTTAGDGCPTAYYDIYTCDPLLFNFGMTCAELEQFVSSNHYDAPCNGCPCNDWYDATTEAPTQCVSCC